ncbi:DUF4179 domain-containing protein [Clostridium gasigenes]|uniref:DUF4179 domain-containing protein n=1 Tax=Clostridium gasigenes TaxID=94869 RepID=A0A1H0Q240_9CLOT|nr:DUF4179 domain-containing protein [Clostridium gasigenes]MBU3088122.1 DUF4179 domain-containing protein [Clostridium gasigenes]SDP11404.1 protein of unknown function [Clostridium gasigenes]
MDENIKELIKIPEGLDNAILKGFEDGKKKNKGKKRINIIKRSTIAAAVAIASITVVGVVNPKIVSAIPIVNRVFGYFDNSGIGFTANKYEELGEVINKTIDKNGTKVTLDQILVDDNTFIASFTVESEALRGFEDMKNPGDFFRPDIDLRINGEIPGSWEWRHTVRIIDDTKGVVVFEGDISNSNLQDDLEVDFNIKNIERAGKVIAKGNWEYNIKTTKGINSETYTGDRKLKVDGGELWVDSLVKTPISNLLTINGKYESGTNETLELDNLEYIIRDNKGNELITAGLGGHSDVGGNYQRKIKILSDLSNVEYIEILQYERAEEKSIRREMNGINRPLLICTETSTDNINRKEEVISREPTKEELDRGYGLPSVQYALNINRSKSFMQIDDLKGKVIKTSDNSDVTITNVEADDKATKISMKIEGSYNYKNLSSLVIFDEDMNDTCRWEGHEGAVIENIETKEFSMTLGAIDKSKKYTIGIPMEKESKYNEESKIVVSLKR